eukprot:TRINITY_DN70207_c0_g1_i1.p1 TRINITY_DN70207_c0_g1~~TRINITY_DN70207_c0_g1_i1.p1  ORF type:complete len:338 (+),score=12.53 TRINITY_DN70207_c0_g1_i1:1-1014(+)
MFQTASKELFEALAEAVVQDIIPPQQYVCHIHEVGTEMYFLSQGVVEIIVPDPETGANVIATHLSDGSWFGEIALLQEIKRTASVRTITETVLFKLDKKHFSAIVERYPQFKETLQKIVQQRINNNNKHKEGSSGAPTPAESSPDEITAPHSAAVESTTGEAYFRRPESMVLHRGTFDIHQNQHFQVPGMVGVAVARFKSPILAHQYHTPPAVLSSNGTKRSSKRTTGGSTTGSKSNSNSNIVNSPNNPLLFTPTGDHLTNTESINMTELNGLNDPHTSNSNRGSYPQDGSASPVNGFQEPTSLHQLMQQAPTMADALSDGSDESEHPNAPNRGLRW